MEGSNIITIVNANTLKSLSRERFSRYIISYLHHISFTQHTQMANCEIVLWMLRVWVSSGSQLSWASCFLLLEWMVQHLLATCWVQPQTHIKHVQTSLIICFTKLNIKAFEIAINRFKSCARSCIFLQGHFFSIFVSRVCNFPQIYLKKKAVLFHQYIFFKLLHSS